MDKQKSVAWLTAQLLAEGFEWNEVKSALIAPLGFPTYDFIGKLLNMKEGLGASVNTVWHKGLTLVIVRKRSHL